MKARRHDASDARRVVSLSKNGRVIAARIAPLVLAAFVGPCPDGMEGCHNDGDCTNDLLSNLRWDTRSANNLDAVRHHTHHAARKTHCKRGHALVPPNLTAFSMANGIRWCLACGKARSAAHYASSKGRPFDMQAAADRHYRRIMEESPCLAT